jgi:hypothetical protein
MIMKLHTLVLLGAAVMAPAVFAQAPPAPSPEMQAARDAMMKACATDASTLCTGKQGREMFMCLRSNNDKVSPGCKEAMSKMPQRPPQPPAAQ